MRGLTVTGGVNTSNLMSLTTGTVSSPQVISGVTEFTNTNGVTMAKLKVTDIDASKILATNADKEIIAATNVPLLNSNNTFTGNLDVGGDTSVLTFDSSGVTQLATGRGATTVGGTLTVNGAESATTGVTIAAGKTLTVGNGSTTLGGTLDVTGDTSVTSLDSSGITQLATQGGATSVGGTLDVTGDTSVSTFDSSGVTQVATGRGATTVGGTLTINGAESTADGVTIAAGKKLTVGSGATTLGGTLDVTGDTSVTSLDSSGITQLATGGGATSVGGALNATGTVFTPQINLGSNITYGGSAAPFQMAKPTGRSMNMVMTTGLQDNLFLQTAYFAGNTSNERLMIDTYVYFSNNGMKYTIHKNNTNGGLREDFRIEAGGQTLTRGAVGNLSDDRYKVNEEPLSSCLDTIRKLKPTKYYLTDDKFDADCVFETNSDDIPIRADGNIIRGSWQDGFIAQEVLEISELKHLVNDQRENESFDDGEGSTISNMEITIMYDGIFVRSVQALQELDRKVSQLEARILTLENRDGS